MQEVSRVCKIAANIHILKTTLFPRFQDIRLGCCTVAAHRARLAGLEPATFSVVRSQRLYPAKLQACELVHGPYTLANSLWPVTLDCYAMPYPKDAPL